MLTMETRNACQVTNLKTSVLSQCSQKSQVRILDGLMERSDDERLNTNLPQMMGTARPYRRSYSMIISGGCNW